MIDEDNPIVPSRRIRLLWWIGLYFGVAGLLPSLAHFFSESLSIGSVFALVAGSIILPFVFPIWLNELPFYFLGHGLHSAVGYFIIPSGYIAYIGHYVVTMRVKSTSCFIVLMVVLAIMVGINYLGWWYFITIDSLSVPVRVR